MPTTSGSPTLAEAGKAEVERIAREQAADPAIEKHVTLKVNTECAEAEVGLEGQTERVEWAVTAYCRHYWDKAKGWWAGATGTVRW